MSNATETYNPTKPAAAHSDDEVREGPDFRTLRSSMPEMISDETVLGLARQVIETRWNTIRDSRLDEVVGDFVEQLLICDPELEKVDRIVITKNEDGVSVEFKKERAPRWTEQTYLQHAGAFTKEYRSERHPDASGNYTLRIAAGRNEDEKVFMELEEPSGRVLAFPPRNAESPVDNAQRKEVSSISRLLRDSTHKTTLSVWQYFGLKRSDDERNEG